MNDCAHVNAYRLHEHSDFMRCSDCEMLLLRPIEYPWHLRIAKRIVRAITRMFWPWMRR